MTIKSNKTILNLFLCTLALIALTACGGSGGGGGSTPTAKKEAVCSNPANPPVNEVACYVTRTAYTAPDATTVIADGVLTEVQTRYTAVPAGATLAQAVEKIQEDAEYQASGGADQIGAAYAYARGHTGEDVIVSLMGGVVSNNHGDVATNLLVAIGVTNPGYVALGGANSGGAGTCASGSSCTAENSLQSTHLAGIIAGVSGNFLPPSGGVVQGIAYDAKIKPVDIFSGDVFNTTNDATKIMQLGNAIVAASGSTITVMNNGWDRPADGGYDEDGDETADYHYNRAGRFDDIPLAERPKWETATETTVVVFGAGDNGHNSENGRVKLFDKDNHETKIFEEGSETEQRTVAWSSIAGGGGNQASSHARLPLLTSGAKSKWLAVIALDPNNRIADFSNGCGDAELWCLGAPGVDITSAEPDGSYESLSGTAQAAAHVSGAVAVLKSAFDHLTPAQLVEVILITADDLGVAGVDDIYGYGALNLAKATEPIGSRTICLPSYTTGQPKTDDTGCMDKALATGITLDNSGITLPTSFGGALDGFTVGFIDDYKRAYIGNPTRITQKSASFTLGDTIATWESPELKNIQLDSNSKMQFTNYDENADAKNTLIFTHNLPNHTIGFSYNEESKTPDFKLADNGDDLHFQKIRPIASDLMQVNSTHKLGKNLTVKNAITSGEFDTGKRFNEAMTNLNYTGENHNLTIGAGTLQEYGQFLGASGTGAYQLSDATSSQVTHLAITQNLPRNSAVKVKYTNFKTEVDMRYNNFANINDLTADEYQLTFAKKQLLGKNDSLNLDLIQPFAVTDGNLQQSTVLGYNAEGDYNNVTQNYTLAPANRRQQLRMTWQNQLNLERKTKLFISMQYENNVNNLRDNEDSQILGGISTRF